MAKERQETLATGGGQPAARNPMLDIAEFVELLEVSRFSAVGRPAAYDADDIRQITHAAYGNDEPFDINSMAVVVARNEDVTSSDGDFLGFDNILESPLLEEYLEEDEAPSASAEEEAAAQPEAARAVEPVPSTSTAAATANHHACRRQQTTAVHTDWQIRAIGKSKVEQIQWGFAA